VACAMAASAACVCVCKRMVVMSNCMARVTYLWLSIFLIMLAELVNKFGSNQQLCPIKCKRRVLGRSQSHYRNH
jgi:hypothetical protein